MDEITHLLADMAITMRTCAYVRKNGTNCVFKTSVGLYCPCHRHLEDEAKAPLHTEPMYKSVLDAIRVNPLLLRQTLPIMERMLQRHAGKVVLAEGETSGAQGTGNKVTGQEASFAAVLESHGFVIQAKDTEITVAGKYYYYQVNGSQKSIDFRLVQHDGTKIVGSADFDLKHTVSDVFFLNDGWFHENVIYVVSWMRKTSEARKKRVTEPATFIGLGQDIPTKEETALMEELLAIKKKYNTEFKGCGSLCTYIRFANRYTCARFTPEYTDRCYERISHSSSSSAAVPVPVVPVTVVSSP
jgi:hypothetical protein